MTLSSDDRLDILELLARADNGVHLTLNAVIDPVPGRPGQAIATSTLIIIDPGPPPAVRHVSTIVQQVVKTGPTWLVARRTVSSP